MIRVILAIVRVSMKYQRQSPEGLPQPDSPKTRLAARPEGFTKDMLCAHTLLLHGTANPMSPRAISWDSLFG